MEKNELQQESKASILMKLTEEVCKKHGKLPTYND